MSFNIRHKKTPSGTMTRQVVENKRVDGKPTQKVLASLASSETIAGAIESVGRAITVVEREIRGYEAAASAAALHANRYPSRPATKLPIKRTAQRRDYLRRLREKLAKLRAVRELTGLT